MNGVDVVFTYSDKPIFFDPYGMLKEFKHRSAEPSVQSFDLKLPFSEQLLNFPCPGLEDQPNVICRCSQNGREFKVSRFSLKYGIYPLSFYRFELDGTLVGTFRRKYDYGSQIQKIATELASQNISAIDIDKENWLWKNHLGSSVFLEKFGHSQLWSFSNSDFLE